MDRLRNLASQKAVVIFSKSSCYICHSIQTLFYELGANPAIHELDHEANGREIDWALRGLGCNPSVPAVFIGGKFIGSAKDVISLHVNGDLKQMLIDAKAIWLWCYKKQNQMVFSLFRFVFLFCFFLFFYPPAFIMSKRLVQNVVRRLW